LLARVDTGTDVPNESLLCLDIQTVPDRDLIPPDWPADKFPKPMWHRVVAISFVEAAIERDRATGFETYIVKCCRTGSEASYNEQQLIQGYWSFFSRAKGGNRIVTWNGKSFDLPVLYNRAMMYGLQASAWFKSTSKFENYTYRYASDWHCDLMEQLSDYKATAPIGMDDAAVAIGLPGKIGGHGSEVAAMIERGDIGQVRAYCEADCLNLFALYVRWALLVGKTDPVGHNASLRSLIECLEKDRDTRPHFGEFLDRWRASDRPVSMFVPEPKPAVEPEPTVA
jgi:predicted PolB exonuclease-like 3'-5' exonuclease